MTSKIKNIFIALPIILSVVLLVSSCASILNGKNQKIDVNSYPTGARVYVDGEDTGVITPAKVKVRRKSKGVTLTLQKQGYEDNSTKLNSKFNPTVIANIVLGGIPGALIDLGTGAFYKYGEKNIFFELNPTTNTESAPAQSIQPPMLPNYERVTRDTPGETSLERTIIRWNFDSSPAGARIFWRVISSNPHEVKNTNELYLAPTPYEETRSFNILGLTYENANDVTIEIKVRKAGYMDQVKRFNVRQAIDQQEISSFFELVKDDTK